MQLNMWSKKCAAYALAIIAFGVAQPSHAVMHIETDAPQAVVVDVETDTVLFTKEAFKQMYPASMTKMMTAHILFEQLRDGKLTLEDSFKVSEKAWKKGGSKMFVKVNTDVKVSDLLRGIIVQSGNDACIVVAEGLAGTEEGFADMMNEAAAKMGLQHSHFKNSTGWPDEEHVTSPWDLYQIAKASIVDFPEYYPIYAEESFTYSGIKQPNRNLLLDDGIGVDGLKTGHTEASGYGITISGVNPEDGRRLIVVVNGLDSEKARAEESKRLLMWGYRNFENKTLWDAGEEVTAADVWFGESTSVPMVTEDALRLTLPKGNDAAKLSVSYMGPLQAPVAKGERVGTLKVEIDGRDPQEIALVAGADVPKLSPFARIVPAIKHYFFQPE